MTAPNNRGRVSRISANLMNLLSGRVSRISATFAANPAGAGNRGRVGRITVTFAANLAPVSIGLVSRVSASFAAGYAPAYWFDGTQLWPVDIYRWDGAVLNLIYANTVDPTNPPTYGLGVYGTGIYGV